MINLFPNLMSPLGGGGSVISPVEPLITVSIGVASLAVAPGQGEVTANLRSAEINISAVVPAIGVSVGASTLEVQI